MDFNVNNIGYNDLQKIVESMNANGVTATLSDKSVDNVATITFSVNGHTESIQVTLPEIDPPDVKEEDTKSVAEKLQDFVDKLGTSKNNGGDVMFSLYEMTELLLRMAQQQRKNASEMREGEHKAVQKSMTDNAQSIRDNAATVAGVSNAAAWIQAGAQILGIGLSIGGAIATAKAYSNSSAGQVSGQMSDVKSQMKSFSSVQTIEQEGKPTVNHDSVQNALGEDCAKSYDKLTTARSEVDNAEIKCNSIDEKVAEKQGEVDSIKMHLADGVEDGNGNITYKDGQSQDVTKSKADLQGELDTKLTELEALQGQSKDAHVKLDAAKIKAADCAMELNKMVDKRATEITKDPNMSQQQKLDACSMKQALRENMKGDAEAGLKIKLTELKTQYEEKFGIVMHSKSMKTADAVMAFAQAFAQLGQGIGGVVNSGAHEQEAQGQASGKEADAQTEQHRMEVDKAKEVQESAREMVQAVLDLARNLSKLEHETMGSLINNI